MLAQPLGTKIAHLFVSFCARGKEEICLLGVRKVVEIPIPRMKGA